MYQDRSFQEENKTFQNQEVHFENPVGKFRNERPLVDIKITSKGTGFDLRFYFKKSNKLRKSLKSVQNMIFYSVRYWIYYDILRYSTGSFSQRKMRIL